LFGQRSHTNEYEIFFFVMFRDVSWTAVCFSRQAGETPKTNQVNPGNPVKD